jgi:hypothetical protein
MSNVATLLPPIKKGEKRCGRAKGQTNKITRALKTALILAGAMLLSEHRDGHREMVIVLSIFEIDMPDSAKPVEAIWQARGVAGHRGAPAC